MSHNEVEKGGEKKKKQGTAIQGKEKSENIQKQVWLLNITIVDMHTCRFV